MRTPLSSLSNDTVIVEVPPGRRVQKLWYRLIDPSTHAPVPRFALDRADFEDDEVTVERFATEVVKRLHLTGVSPSMRRVFANRAAYDMTESLACTSSLSGFSEDNILIVEIPTTRSNKRTLAELKDKLPSHSSFAQKNKHGWRAMLIKYQDEIMCHRVTTTTTWKPPPVVLMHSTFAHFAVDCKSIDFGNDDCNFVARFCRAIAARDDSAWTKGEVVRRLLTEYLLEDWTSSCIHSAVVGKSVSDGSYLYRDHLLLNLSIEKNKFNQTSDPTMENIAYYVKQWPKVPDGSIPCYLLDLRGPIMSVYGLSTSGTKAWCVSHWF